MAYDPDASAHYRIFRDYTVHEDDLINHRSTWHNAIQGLLFTALGIVLQWKPAPNSASLETSLQHALLILLPVLGAAVGISGFLSILAADKALNTLRAHWESVALSYPPDIIAAMPPLTGGGNEQANAWGKIPALLIPIFITAVWLILLAIDLHFRMIHVPTT